MFGLKHTQIEAIQGCFDQFPSIRKVILFGSRAKGNYKNGSDFDLAIEGDLEFAALLKLENRLKDLMLPYKIEIVLLHQIANSDLLDHIGRVGVVFYERKQEGQSG